MATEFVMSDKLQIPVMIKFWHVRLQAKAN